MRLLTNDEMFAVSGGHINGQDDPTSLDRNGNSPAELSKACPGGWKKTGRRVSLGRDGVKYQGIDIECDTGNGSDNDSNDSGDGSQRDSGNDSGGESEGGGKDD